MRTTTTSLEDATRAVAAARERLDGLTGVLEVAEAQAIEATIGLASASAASFGERSAARRAALDAAADARMALGAARDEVAAAELAHDRLRWPEAAQAFEEEVAALKSEVRAALASESVMARARAVASLHAELRSMGLPGTVFLGASCWGSSESAVIGAVQDAPLTGR